VIAYKFLAAGAVGPFSGFGWPTTGEWVEAADELDVCRNGIHACTVDELSEWVGDELWTIELGGRILQEEGVLVAERGRLLERIEAWNADAAQGFAVDCARRLREHAEADERLRPFAEDAETQIGLASDPKLIAVVAFIARHAAEQAEMGGWDAERALQSRAIGERVGL
jgi:hypothetical protein